MSASSFIKDFIAARRPVRIVQHNPTTDTLQVGGSDINVVGLDGADGADGADGNTILYGAVAPTTEGVNGDFYINTATNYIYGPKTAGVWPAGVSIIGAAGADGNTILYGAVDPTTEGVNGNFYINTATNYIYGPKTAGVWPAGTSIVGPFDYDVDTGQIIYNDAPVSGIASMTFSQMEALTADQLLALAGFPVHIHDVHNNSSGIGGSYVVRDSSPAGWAQISGPMYYATFDLAPSPTTYAGWRIRVGDCGLGGADMLARGGYWRYTNGRQLVGSVTDLTFSTNKDTEQSAIKVTIPTNNSKSLLQNGDSVWIEVHGSKSGTADRISRNIRIGTDASTVTNNTNFDPMVTGTAANIGLDEHITFHRISATSIQRDSAQLWSSNSGMTTTARYSAVAVTSLDSALQYLDLTIYLTDGAADGIADTMSITSAKIFFDHGF